MAKKKMAPANTGRYVFLLGIAVALVAGIVAEASNLGNYAGWIALVLVLLGLIVGYLNITPKERHAFLVAVIALALLGVLNLGTFIGGAAITGGVATALAYVTSIFNYIAIFVVPAGVIAALYEIYDLAKA